MFTFAHCTNDFLLLLPNTRILLVPLDPCLSNKFDDHLHAHLDLLALRDKKRWFINILKIIGPKTLP